MVAGDFALKPKQHQQQQQKQKKNKNKNKTKIKKHQTKPNKTKKHISQSSFFHISSETKCFFFLIWPKLTLFSSTE